MPIGGSRAYPTENQPLSYAQQYGAAAQPPTTPTPTTWGAATNGNTPSATIGYGGGYSGVQSAYQPPAQPSNGQPGANVIGGQLPWGAGGGSMFQGMNGDPATVLANLGANYQNAYNSSLAQNQSNYNNILAGYQQTAGNQAAGQAATQAGYGALSNNVMAGIANIGSDQQQLLGRQYDQQRGTAMQGLINSGLGNSTVTASVNRGIGLDQSLAQNNLANSIAQTKAGYQSNLGLAGLNYQGQSVRDNTALAGQQLNWMNSVNAGYPDAAQYGALAQQAGAAIQANANRAQIDRLAGQNADVGAQVRQQAVLGGSGGMSPGTGGRLPPSSINYGTGSVGSTGSGSGPLNLGADFFSSGTGARPPGTAGGGAMQNATGTRPGVSASSSPGAGPGVANATMSGFGADGLPVWTFAGGFNQSGPAASLPVGTGTADQGGFWNSLSDPSLYGDPGAAQGYDPWSNPFGFGAPDAASYDPASNPFGFGGDFTTDWGGGTDPGYNPDEYMGSAFPSYDYTAGAQGLGADLFGGAFDSYDGGY